MAENQDRGPVTHLVGIVGQAPKKETAGTYGDVVKFSLAVSDGFTDDATTTWFDVTVWKEALQPVVMAQIYKGAKVAVTGWVKTREYNDKTYYSITGSRIGLIEYLVPGAAVAAAPTLKTEEVDW